MATSDTTGSGNLPLLPLFSTAANIMPSISKALFELRILSIYLPKAELGTF